MTAYVVAGLVVGWLARMLWNDSDDPGILTVLMAGVVAAVVGV